MPAGRPTKYKKEYCDQVIDMMSKGLSKEAAAAKLGICKQSFYNWQEDHSEFLDAVKEGERQSLLWWETIGIAGMTGKVDGFNATTWIFNMKNRHEWKDTKDIRGNVKHDHKHQHTHEPVSETADWITGLLGTDTQGKAKKPRAH